MPQMSTHLGNPGHTQRHSDSTTLLTILSGTESPEKTGTTKIGGTHQDHNAQWGHKHVTDIWVTRDQT